MIGCRGDNSDIYIFFEGDEVEELGKRKLIGTLVNLEDKSKRGVLEIIIGEIEFERIRTDITMSPDEKLIETIKVIVRKEYYERFVERRAVEEHQGYRHISLLDANNLDFNDRITYEQLKHYISSASSTSSMPA